MSEKEETLIQLAPGGMQGFEFQSTRYDALVPTGVPVEALAKPEFWAHQGAKLRPWDEIRARAEDGSWMANLVVLDCSRTWARVKLLNYHKCTTGDVALTQASEEAIKAHIEQHKLMHRGPRKWSIVRVADGTVIAEDIATKEEAAAQLDAVARRAVGAPAAARRDPVAV